MYPLSNRIWGQVVVGRKSKSGSLCLDLRKYTVSKQKLIPNKQEGLAIPQNIWRQIVDLIGSIEKALEEKEEFRKEFYLSERSFIIVEVSIFKKKAYCDIRDYFTLEGEEEKRPSKRGCKLDKEGFAKLQEILGDVEADFKVLKQFS